MFLEEVGIEGFKSYATKARVAFKPGIGVIVGNNGVGKSNILDGVAWALGECDLGRLRCSSYDDLFFSGSGEYPAAETAKVELTLRLGRDKNAPVVKMARQADRRGKEAFYADGAEVSSEVYLGKIIGLNMQDAVRTLIRQEKINHFIHMTPGERLVYLADLTGRQPVQEDIINRLNAGFKNLFQVLIPEGDAGIFTAGHGGEAGLAVEASFPGKGMKNSMLLSGGEKTICSLALNLAIFDQLQSPFFLFDEVEPSLDWANHRQMQSLFRKLAEKRQLIMITHLRSTIELADSLHGIRARKDGTSFIKFYFEMNERLLRAYKCC